MVSMKAREKTITKKVTCPECYAKFPVVFYPAAMTAGRAVGLGMAGFFMDNWAAEESCANCGVVWKIERGTFSGASNKMQRVLDKGA